MSQITHQDKGLLRGVARGALMTVAALIGLIIVAAIVLPRFIGAVPLTVLTGSMEPMLHPGDLIVSQQIDPDKVRVGDIITYQPQAGDPALITHRVKAIAFGMNGIDHFTTRGDANGVDDAPVKPGQVMGKYVYDIPYLGYVAHAIPPAIKPFIVQGIGVVLLLWAAVQLINAVRAKRRAARQAHNTRPRTEREAANVTR